MSGTLNQLLPEDDFWRTATFCIILVFLVPLVAITGALAPEALVLGVFLTFVAWVVSRWSESADETTQIEDEQELDALETLRKRYANGDIGETEFEHRLDRLLETESPAPREKELSFE